MENKNNKNNNNLIATKDNNKNNNSKGEKTMEKLKGIITINLKNANNVKCFEYMRNDLETMSTKGFELGVIGYYLNGGNIPTYTTKNGVVVNVTRKSDGDTMTITDIANSEYLKDYDRSTISRMITAVKLIIENGDFNKFATTDTVRRLTFTYDKVISFYNNKDVMRKNGVKSINDAFKKSVRDLREIVKPKNDVKTATKSDDKEQVIIEYNGKKYSVNRKALEAFLESSCPISK